MYYKFEQFGFFFDGVYPHWYNFQLSFIIVEKVFRNFFLQPCFAAADRFVIFGKGCSVVLFIDT